MERSGSLPRLLGYPRDGKVGWVEDAMGKDYFCGTKDRFGVVGLAELLNSECDGGLGRVALESGLVALLRV